MPVPWLYKSHTILYNTSVCHSSNISWVIQPPVIWPSNIGKVTIIFPISLEDKRKLSPNCMKGESKIQVHKKDYSEGTDFGNDKAKSKSWVSCSPNPCSLFKYILVCILGDFICGLKWIFTRLVEFMQAVTYVLVMLMLSSSCVLFYSLSNLKSRTQII